MAARKKTATEETTEVTEETTAESKGTKEKSYAYSVLKKDCRKLFSVPTITFVAATKELDQSKKYTISEIAALITEWGAKEVK